MGVLARDGSSCAGVLVPVSGGQLPLLDEREIGYDRVRVPISSVGAAAFLTDEYYARHATEFGRSILFGGGDDLVDDDGDEICIWVYVQQDPRPPSLSYPICQSYVDTIIRGCLSYSEEFARDYILSTKGWSNDELHDILLDKEVDDDATSDGSSGSDPANSGGGDDQLKLFWVDDRSNPIYPRGDPAWSRRKARYVDSLFEKYRPQQFRYRTTLLNMMAAPPRSTSTSAIRGYRPRSFSTSSSSTSSWRIFGASSTDVLRQ